MVNHNNVIFINGLSIPTYLSKTRYVWNDDLWKDYNRKYLSSPIAISNLDFQNKLESLIKIVNSVENPVVIGQSLGAWWAANLACTKEVKLNKLILMTPLVDARDVPFFNISKGINPLEKPPFIVGPDKVLVCFAKNDIICPPYTNAYNLLRHFNGIQYHLNGGHFFQKDHTSCLKFMQDWMDFDI